MSAENSNFQCMFGHKSFDWDNGICIHIAVIVPESKPFFICFLLFCLLSLIGEGVSFDGIRDNAFFARDNGISIKSNRYSVFQLIHGDGNRSNFASGYGNFYKNILFFSKILLSWYRKMKNLRYAYMKNFQYDGNLRKKQRYDGILKPRTLPPS